MSIYGRRYDLKQTTLFKYNQKKREEELSLYELVSNPSDQEISFFIDDHTDYIILRIIIFFKKKYIDERICNKLIDIVEGYYFSYENNLLTAQNLFLKLNNEIMGEWLHQDFHFLAILREV